MLFLLLLIGQSGQLLSDPCSLYSTLSIALRYTEYHLVARGALPLDLNGVALFLYYLLLLAMLQTRSGLWSGAQECPPLGSAN